MPAAGTYICSTLCFTRAAKTSNHIPSSLGLYLHGNGVKRRVISTMAGFGLCVSYNTISRNAEQISEAAKESFIHSDSSGSSDADTHCSYGAAARRMTFLSGK